MNLFNTYTSENHSKPTRVNNAYGDRKKPKNHFEQEECY